MTHTYAKLGITEEDEMFIYGNIKPMKIYPMTKESETEIMSRQYNVPYISNLFKLDKANLYLAMFNRYLSVTKIGNMQTRIPTKNQHVDIIRAMEENNETDHDIYKYFGI